MATTLCPKPWTQAPALLTIPREIRALIYTDLRRTPNSPPASPNDVGPRFETQVRRSSILVTCLAGERYLEHVHLNLLLVNHQIHTELSGFLNLSHGATPDGVFVLDCMMSKKSPCSLWPTWITFPGPVTYIPTLEVDLRVFEYESDGGLRSRQDLSSHSGAVHICASEPPSPLWSPPRSWRSQWRADPDRYGGFQYLDPRNNNRYRIWTLRSGTSLGTH